MAQSRIPLRDEDSSAGTEITCHPGIFVARRAIALASAASFVAAAASPFPGRMLPRPDVLPPRQRRQMQPRPTPSCSVWVRLEWKTWWPKGATQRPKLMQIKASAIHFIKDMRDPRLNGGDNAEAEQRACLPELGQDAH